MPSQDAKPLPLCYEGSFVPAEYTPGMPTRPLVLVDAKFPPQTPNPPKPSTDKQY